MLGQMWNFHKSRLQNTFDAIFEKDDKTLKLNPHSKSIKA